MTRISGHIIHSLRFALIGSIPNSYLRFIFTHIPYPALFFFQKISNLQLCGVEYNNSVPLAESD